MRAWKPTPATITKQTHHQPSATMDFLEIIDSGIYDVFSAWNIYTAVLALLLSAVVVQTIASAVDADIHPMILQRQASAARVRQPGESAVYRAPEVPEGMPLRSGLAVKLPTDKMYSSGRDGDLRFVWKRVIGEIALPPIPGTAQVPPKKQEILSVRGKEEIENYRIKDLTQQIAVIGDHLSKHGGKRIAIYLPNSVEFLNTLFGKNSCLIHHLIMFLTCNSSNCILRPQRHSNSVQSSSSNDSQHSQNHKRRWSHCSSWFYPFGDAFQGQVVRETTHMGCRKD